MKKRAKMDLLIVCISALVPAVVYLFFEQQWRFMNQNPNMNFGIKFLVQCLLSFSLAGLGFIIVMIIRKESFKVYGLVKKIQESQFCCPPSRFCHILYS